MLSVLRSFWLYILTLLCKRNKIRRSQSAISLPVLTVPTPQASVSEQVSDQVPQLPAQASIGSPISIVNISDSAPADTNPDDIPLSLLLSQAKARRLGKKRKTGAPKHSKHRDVVVNDWNSLGDQKMSNIFLSTAQMMSGSGSSYTEAPLDVRHIERPMEIRVSSENGPSITLYRDPHYRSTDLESTFKPSAFSTRALSATAGFLADPSCPTGRSTLLPQSTPTVRSIISDGRCSPYTDFFDFDMYARPISVESHYSTASTEERTEQFRSSESAKRVLAPATNIISGLKLACENELMSIV